MEVMEMQRGGGRKIKGKGTVPTGQVGGMRAAVLVLICVIVYSLDAAIVSRHKRSFGFQFKSFKLTKRPSLPPPVMEDDPSFDAPDTSFVVEKAPATMRPQFIDTTPRRLTLEEKFNLDLAAHRVRTTTMPTFFQTTQGGLWDFL